MIKDIDKLFDETKGNLAYYLNMNLYIPMKEELVGVEHSLCIRKEMFNSYIDIELERLKTEIKKRMTTDSKVDNE